MCARWSPVLLSGDGHTSVRGRREAPRDEADLCWQLLLQLLCIFQFQVQRRAAIRSSCSSAGRGWRPEEMPEEIDHGPLHYKLWRAANPSPRCCSQGCLAPAPALAPLLARSRRSRRLPQEACLLCRLQCSLRPILISLRPISRQHDFNIFSQVTYTRFQA